MLGEHTIYARQLYRVSNDRKLTLRHSFMLHQLYQIHALSTLRKYVLDMEVHLEVRLKQNAKQLTAI